MRKTQLVVALSALGFAGSAMATNGYFSHGYGMKAKGMGGASTAMAVDTFGGANNPASMIWVGDRIDLGADLFSPRREASMTVPGPTTFTSESDSNYFLVPEFGYNKMLKPNMSVGVTVYGNGGMNTDYDPIATLGPANLLGGASTLGVDLMQLIIAPTLSYKVNEQNSVGISPLLGYQRFKANGLDGFGLPADPGYDDSTGFGVRVGWMGKVSDTVTLGAAYASKMNMSKMNKYAGLFAEQGDFDIPSNWNLGIAVQATPAVKVAMDYQRINYSDVKSVNNASANIFNCPGFGGADPSACLGGANGPGFGWKDINVVKLGVEYQYSKTLTLRAGYNHGENPISAADVTFNILAPGVVKDHLTLGFTYVTASGGELTMSYMHAFSNDVTGAHLFAGLPGPNPPAGTTNNIKMHQDSIGLAYSWKM
jgi:long-chain fatty acid transport protein